MSNLILFDIDGTLLRSGPLHHEAFLHAIKNVFGKDFKGDPHVAGLTDPLILSMFLREMGTPDAVIQQRMPELLQACEDYYVKKFIKSSVEILPGVKELLKSLHQAGATLMLVTGNLEPIAKAKLESLDIYHYFSGGGFGSDPHSVRSELVTLAITKAGFEKNINDVYLTGDTPRDVKAAQEGGVTHIIAVATGTYTASELKDSGAETALESFEDTAAALRAFGY